MWLLEDYFQIIWEILVSIKYNPVKNLGELFIGITSKSTFFAQHWKTEANTSFCQMHPYFVIGPHFIGVDRNE